MNNYPKKALTKITQNIRNVRAGLVFVQQMKEKKN